MSNGPPPQKIVYPTNSMLKYPSTPKGSKAGCPLVGLNGPLIPNFSVKGAS